MAKTHLEKLAAADAIAELGSQSESRGNRLAEFRTATSDG